MAIEKMNTHYSMTNPASVYDEETLTALELVGRTTAKINEVIDSQNALNINTENRLGAQDTKITNEFNAIRSEVEVVQSEHDAVVERRLEAQDHNISVIADNKNVSAGQLREITLTDFDYNIINGTDNKIVNSLDGELVVFKTVVPEANNEVVMYKIDLTKVRNTTIFSKYKASTSYTGVNYWDFLLTEYAEPTATPTHVAHHSMSESKVDKPYYKRDNNGFTVDVEKCIEVGAYFLYLTVRKEATPVFISGGIELPMWLNALKNTEVKITPKNFDTVLTIDKLSTFKEHTDTRINSYNTETNIVNIASQSDAVLYEIDVDEIKNATVKTTTAYHSPSSFSYWLVTIAGENGEHLYHYNYTTGVSNSDGVTFDTNGILTVNIPEVLKAHPTAHKLYIGMPYSWRVPVLVDGGVRLPSWVMAETSSGTGATTDAKKFEFVLPSVIPTVSFIDTDLYFDSFCKCDDINKYYFTVEHDDGVTVKIYNDRLVLTNMTEETNCHIEISARDNYTGEVVATTEFYTQCRPPYSSTKSILTMGDSLTSRGQYQTWICGRNMENTQFIGDNETYSMIYTSTDEHGEMCDVTDEVTIMHSGKSGYNSFEYLSDLDYVFNNLISTPTDVVIMLGTNGVDRDDNVTNIQAIIDRLRSTYPNPNIFVCLVPPPAYQTGCGWKLGTFSAQAFKNSVMELNKKYITAFDTPENRARGIYVVATHAVINRAKDFPFTNENIDKNTFMTQQIQTDNVHFNDKGYADIGDIIFSALCYSDSLGVG